jgi:hypothetical protein
MAPVVVEM